MGHPDRFLSLNNLAVCLSSRFDLQKSVTDLEEAISHHRAALEFRPIGHPDRSYSLKTLASCLESRFGSQRIVADLDEAIVYRRAVLEDDSSEEPRGLALLADSLEARFRYLGT